MILAPNSTSIGLVIASDDGDLLQTLSNAIDADAELKVVGVAGDPGFCRTLLRSPALRVLIVSLAANSAGRRPFGIDFIARARDQRDDLGILLLERQIDEPLMRAALEAGATACCLTSAAPSQLIGAIKTASVGATWLDREISRVVFRAAADRMTMTFRLTERERAVLQLIAKGFSNGEMADALHCTAGTIHTHVTHVFRKLGVNDRVSAAVYALREGLISGGLQAMDERSRDARKAQ